MSQGLSKKSSSVSNSEAVDQDLVEEPSPVSISEAITPGSGGDYVNFTLFPSSSSSEETDMDLDKHVNSVS